VPPAAVAAGPCLRTFSVQMGTRQTIRKSSHKLVAVLRPLNDGLKKQLRVRGSFSSRRPGFMSRLTYAQFALDEVALGQIFLRILRVSSVNINLPLIPIYSCIICGWAEGQLAAAVPLHSNKKHN
jgi:hypothetical protein